MGSDTYPHQPAPTLRLPFDFGRDRIRRFTQDVTYHLTPVCESEGYELVHVEYRPESGGRILRIYIDKPGGVTLDNCAELSHQVSDLLDVLIASQGTYRLEVSSPGIQRPLSKQADFNRFKGQIVKIKTYEPINGQKNFTGILMGLEADQVFIQTEDKAIAIPHQEIARARLASEG